MIPNYPTWSASKEPGTLDMPAMNLPLTNIPYPRAVGLGPNVFNQAATAVNLRYYVVYHEDDNLLLRRANDDGVTWGDSITLGVLAEKPDTLTLTFNAAGEACVFFEKTQQIYQYKYTPTVSTQLIGVGHGPVAAMDYSINANDPTADIMVAYVRDEKAYYKLEGDSYAAESTIPIADAGATEVEILGIGLRTDKRLQVRLRYIPGVVGGWTHQSSAGTPHFLTIEESPIADACAWKNEKIMLGLGLYAGADTDYGMFPINPPSNGVWTLLASEGIQYPYLGVGIASATAFAPGEHISNTTEVTLKITFPSGSKSFRFIDDERTRGWVPLSDAGVLEEIVNDLDTVEYITNADNDATQAVWLIYPDESLYTLFPGELTDIPIVGYPVGGTFTIELTAKDIVGTLPDLVAKMTFVIKEA